MKLKLGDRVRHDDSTFHNRGNYFGPDIFEGTVCSENDWEFVAIDTWIEKSFYSQCLFNNRWKVVLEIEYAYFTLLNPQPISEPRTKMLPTDSRCKYDDVQGNWRVLFQGRLTKQVFKTVADANAHLRALNEKKVQPEYAA